jgi:hypothetical protein
MQLAFSNRPSGEWSGLKDVVRSNSAMSSFDGFWMDFATDLAPKTVAEVIKNSLNLNNLNKHCLSEIIRSVES